MTPARCVPSTVLVALVDDDSRHLSEAVATTLRRRGVATEVAAGPQKFGKQIRYAERRGIPFVWFPGDGAGGDQVKDIRSGDQVDADPALWQPPDDDLRPRLTVTEPTDLQEPLP